MVTQRSGNRTPCAKASATHEVPGKIERRDHPGLIGELRNAILRRPPTDCSFPRRHEPIVEQDFCRIVGRHVLWVWRCQARQQRRACARPIQENRGSAIDAATTREIRGYFCDNRSMTAGRKLRRSIRATDLDLPSRRLAQEFDVLDALPQLIDPACTRDSRARPNGVGSTPLGPRSNNRRPRCFKTSDNRRHRWLRDAQFGRGLSHAAALGDRE